MSIRTALPRIAGILIIQLASVSGALAAPELTLAEAERLALEHAPWLQHHRTNADAAAERAVYQRRLPDPQLTLGFLNVPTDSFSLSEEDMTMTMVGIRQAFPPGRTLKLKGQVAEKIEMLAPPNAQDYAFEINWQLKGNRMLSSPRQKGMSDVVYVDELPTH